MAEMTIEVDLSVGGSEGPINVEDADTLHYRFESTGASAPSTAVLSSILMMSERDTGYGSASMTISGTAASVDVSDVAFVKFAVTTAEAGKQGNLHIYTRKTTL